ncbi:hypothetical protein AMJ82_03230 [candidate division TA06 bacterium SM23_40]|uniref:Uncharacterized protein n=1 Tax=candidate division TA06 bacterium SM23_40 TaxID=1703774 RepID=A0A0S8GC56_UNCT6|nr:MAG: hypothetical protein AMJ82_03230 [candidate division TA06 bacterium SM23_40]
MNMTVCHVGGVPFEDRFGRASAWSMSDSARRVCGAKYRVPAPKQCRTHARSLTGERSLREGGGRESISVVVLCSLVRRGIRDCSGVCAARSDRVSDNPGRHRCRLRWGYCAGRRGCVHR